LPGGLLTYGLLQTSGPASSILLDEGPNWFRLGFSIVGTYVIRAEVSDGELTGSDDVTITVNGGSNQPLAVALTAPLAGASAVYGTDVDLIATASDPENNLLRVEFYDGSTLLGATVSYETQVSGFRFLVSSLPLGQRTLTAVAVDNLGQRTASASVGIQVVLPAPTVRIAIPADGTHHAHGDPLVINAVTTSSVPVSRVDFLVNGQPAGSDSISPYAVTLDTAPLAVPSTLSLTATVHTTDGPTATAAPITVQILPEVLPPLVEIHLPEDGATVSEPTELIATVLAPAPVSWTLEYRNRDAACADWIVFAEGTQTLDRASAGPFDTTLLLNGIYDIRLRAVIAGWGPITDEITVVVDGRLKLGHVIQTSEDLTLPVGDLGLSIGRRYDSRNKCPGDFGFGWTLDIAGPRLTENYPLVSRWNYDVYIPENFLEPPVYTLLDEGPHIISIAFPNGELYRFKPTLVLKNRGGGIAKLDAFGNVIGMAYSPIYYAEPIGLKFQPLGGSRGCHAQAEGVANRESLELPGIHRRHRCQPLPRRTHRR
jgi:hypothetical protein